MPQGDGAVVDDGGSEADAASAKEFVAVLRTGEPNSLEMYEAFRGLDALAVDVVRAELAAWMGPLPVLDELDAATRLALRLPLRALRLIAVASANDADILDLGPLAEEQVRVAGQTWDGADLPAEERLDGEIEGSFAGTLQRLVLADSDALGAAPLFDVVLFAEDSGVVFASGTTTRLAFIAYGKVEMRDRRTRIAIEAAVTAGGTNPISATGNETPPPPAVPPEPVKKTKLTTRTAARRPAGEAPIAKKVATKRTAAKKTPRRA